jgi:glycosyltransferase involved in cell wall biosynthesis
LRLAEDAFVFLCFGSLRPEKEIPLLLTAFQALASPELVLVVAGNPEDPLASWSTLRAFRADARIRPILGKIPTAGVAELFGAADAAVIPRSENWTSGSLILALSLGVPPVASRLPVHEQLLDGERAGWLFRPGDADSLRDALDRAAGDPPTARAKGEAALRQAMSLPSWPAIAQQTMSLLLGGEAVGTTATDADAGSGSAPRGGATIAAAQRRSWRA